MDEYLYDKYETFASNPLLLTIMLLTFESRVSIPDKLNDFFDRHLRHFFILMMQPREDTKEIFVRGWDMKISKQFLHISALNHSLIRTTDFQRIRC